MKQNRIPVVTLLGAVALLAAACGGGSNGAEPSTTGAASAQATPPAAEEPAAQASPAAASTSEPEAAAVEPRADGLTGAPIPPPTVQSAEYDADLANTRAGAFPPLDYPAVVPAGDASWMEGDDLVLGAVQNGEARAYPIFMLTFHHVANDELGGEPYLVTF